MLIAEPKVKKQRRAAAGKMPMGRADVEALREQWPVTARTAP